MSAHSLEIRILRPLKKYVKDYEKNQTQLEEIDLDYCYADLPSDRYHADLIHKSIYCGMGDIKEHMVKERPDLDWNNWCMRHHHDKSVTIGIGNEEIELSSKTIESLERVHLDKGCYEDVAEIYTMELPWNHGWLEGLLSCYVDNKTILNVAQARMEWARTLEKDDLIEQLGNYEYNGACNDVVGFLCDGLARAKMLKCAAYARMSD